MGSGTVRRGPRRPAGLRRGRPGAAAAAGPTRRRTRREWVRRARVPLTGGLAGAVAWSLLLGGGTAWAYWTSQASVVGGVAPRPVAAELRTDGLDVVLTGDDGIRTSTGSFTVTNRGAEPGTVVAGMYSSEPLAAQVAVSIWPRASADCGAEPVPGSAGRGTWGSAVAPAVPPLASGGSVVFCVRTEASDAEAVRLAQESGRLATSSAVAAIFTAAGWAGIPMVKPVSLRTAVIRPASATPWLPDGLSRFYTLRPRGNGGLCLAAGPGTIVGAPLIVEKCDARASQSFDVVPSATDGPKLVSLRSLAHTRLAVTVGADGRLSLESSGAIVKDQRTQHWWVQHLPGGRKQFVSALDGRCLIIPSTEGSTPLATGPCEESAAAFEPRRTPLLWSGQGSTVRFDLGFHPESLGTYVLESRRAGQTAWVERARITGDARTFEWSMAGADTGRYSLRIVSLTGFVVFDGLAVDRPTGRDVRPTAGFG